MRETGKGERKEEWATRTVRGSKPRNGVPKIRGLSQTEPRGQGGASWGACAQIRDASKNTSTKLCKDTGLVTTVARPMTRTLGNTMSVY